jgi:voltage-dependent potassium channel beta subunit
MEYRKLGKSGLKVSALSFGSWVTYASQVDDGLAVKLMALAYERGVNFFDNAEVYAAGQSEIIMGRALKTLGWGRDTYCVSSKVFWGGDRPTQNGLSRKHIFDACHAALKRLQVDYLDLYFCHRPDPDTPVSEVVWSMNDLLRQGKICYWGTSEWTAENLLEAYEFAKAEHLVGPTMEQPEYNLFRRKRVELELQPLYEKWGLGTTIWSPLASGLLTGKYAKGIPKGSRATLKGYEWLKNRFESPEGQAKIEKANELETLAKDLGMTLAELSIAWCLKNPRVSTVILGASKTEQLETNFKALDRQSLLTGEVMKKIDTSVAAFYA